jgi:hypothetical protein
VFEKRTASHERELVSNGESIKRSHNWRTGAAGVWANDLLDNRYRI